MSYDQIEINGIEDLLNAIEKSLGHGTYRSADDFIERVRVLASKRGQYQNGNVDVKIRRAANGNATLDSKQYQKGIIPGADNGQDSRDYDFTGKTISSVDN